jgi:hypothetical protein
MMAITTSNSINVKAPFRGAIKLRFVFIRPGLSQNYARLCDVFGIFASLLLQFFAIQTAREPIGCRHRSGQSPQEALLEPTLEKIPLIGPADGFQVVEPSLPEGSQDSRRLLFDEGQVLMGIQHVFNIHEMNSWNERMNSVHPGFTAGKD